MGDKSAERVSEIIMSLKTLNVFKIIFFSREVVLEDLQEESLNDTIVREDPLLIVQSL